MSHLRRNILPEDIPSIPPVSLHGGDTTYEHRYINQRNRHQGIKDIQYMAGIKTEEHGQGITDEQEDAEQGTPSQVQEWQGKAEYANHQEHDEQGHALAYRHQIELIQYRIHGVSMDLHPIHLQWRDWRHIGIGLAGGGHADEDYLKLHQFRIEVPLDDVSI